MLYCAVVWLSFKTQKILMSRSVLWLRSIIYNLWMVTFVVLEWIFVLILD